MGQVGEGVGCSHPVVGRLGADVGHGAGARKETGEEGHGSGRAQGLEHILTGELSVQGIDDLKN